MKRTAAAVLVLAALLAAPVLAASRVTVQQIAEMLTSAHASGRADTDIAQGIARYELTERLTGATLAVLSRGAGERTRLALRILADESAFLDAPARELPGGEPPSPAEQKAILERAARYALTYTRNLPNFVCTQLTRRFDDDPSSAHRNKAESLGRLREVDTVVSELTFSGGRERNQVRSVNGQAGSNAQIAPGLGTFGELAALIGSIFAGSDAKTSWSHWEAIGGLRIAVFNYAVDRAHSNFQLSWCCSKWGWRHEKAAYRGELFIEPASGAIFRVTRQAVVASAEFPTRRSDTAVEYGAIRIGGKPWLCPVGSVAISDAVRADRPTDIGLRVHTVNDSEFTEYHKFESESTLVASDLPMTGGETNGPAPAAAPAGPPTPPPPAEVTAAPATTTAVSQPAAQPAEEKPVAPASVVATPVAAAALPAPPPPSSPQTPEAPVDTQAIFRVRTNVVTVRAVVRDGHGNVVGDLRKDDFELFDNGKRQAISSFSVERPTAADQAPTLALRAREPGKTGEAVLRQAAPVANRFVMYLLDDLNLKFEDLSQTRTAAERVLRDSPGGASRVALLTTSGRVALDFTADPAKLSQALDHITPQGRAAVNGRCPDLSYYVAYLVAGLDDQMALNFATGLAVECGLITRPRRAAQIAAEQVLREFTVQTQAVLAAIKIAARRISIMPGSRTLVLVSPGFLTPELESAVNDVIDRAVRSGVVINTLDARGVWVLPGFDAATRSEASPSLSRLKRQYANDEQHAQSPVLMQLAEETGGLAFSNNDFQEGFRRLTAAPEVSYILGFSPATLKADGSYHKLKLTLGTRKGLTVQARKGYFAPKHDVDPAGQAKEEIENAVFSRDEIRDIPVTVRTKVAQGKLAVEAHFDIGGIRLVRENGHNRGSVTATMGLFDDGGNYLKGAQEVVDLDFPDDKLAAAIASGRTVRADFDAPGGSYLVRVVLRDNDGHMSSTSKLVDVP
jgi:VWFA-related protein